MLKNMTPEEHQKIVRDQDDLIQHVFNNLRNLFSCGIFANLGIAVVRHRAELPFNSPVNICFGGSVVVASVFLCFWNMKHGVEKFSRPTKGTKNGLKRIPFAIWYALVTFAVFQASILLQAEQQRRPQIGDGAPSVPVRAAPPEILPAPTQTPVKRN